MAYLTTLSVAKVTHSINPSFHIQILKGLNAHYTWYSAWFLRPRQRNGLNASMYLRNPSPSTSTSVDTAINASSWTPPALHEFELNIWRRAVIMASEICGASSGVTFLNTLCNTNTSTLRKYHKQWVMGGIFSSGAVQMACYVLKGI